MIKHAKATDLDVIVSLATKTRENMLLNGLKQWTGNYPDRESFERDLKKDGLYIYKDGENIIASISILPENDEAYKEIEWLKYKSLVIHRVVVDPNKQKTGIGMELFDFAKQIGKQGNYESIKVDTHPDNYKMQGLIAKAGYKPIGYLSGINRLAYELVL